MKNSIPNFALKLAVKGQFLFTNLIKDDSKGPRIIFPIVYSLILNSFGSIIKKSSSIVILAFSFMLSLRKRINVFRNFRDTEIIQMQILFAVFISF